jgi:inner membrane protein
MSVWPEWFKPELVWFLIGLALLLTELVTPGIVLGFFGIGAWIVALVCLVTDIGINWQLVIFLVSSIVLLILLRRRLMSLFGEHTDFENLADSVDVYTGKKVVVTRDIPLNMKGRVELNGTNWDAVADEFIAQGTVVEIMEKNNITFKVKPV